MSDKQYLCMIGDLIDSKKISDRGRFQQRLQATIERINQAGNSVSPWTLTLGDEFQAVYEDERGVWQDVLTMMAGLWPQRVRFALVTGPLSTSINRKQALGMDGPAFHAARETIGGLKKQGRSIGVGFVGKEAEQKVLAVIGALIGKLLYQGRTSTRVDIFRGLLAGQTRAGIAKAIGVSASAVSQQIETAALEDLIEGARLIESSWKQSMNSE